MPLPCVGIVRFLTWHTCEHRSLPRPTHAASPARCVPFYRSHPRRQSHVASPAFTVASARSIAIVNHTSTCRPHIRHRSYSAVFAPGSCFSILVDIVSCPTPVPQSGHPLPRANRCTRVASFIAPPFPVSRRGTPQASSRISPQSAPPVRCAALLHFPPRQRAGGQGSHRVVQSHRDTFHLPGWACVPLTPRRACVSPYRALLAHVASHGVRAVGQGRQGVSVSASSPPSCTHTSSLYSRPFAGIQIETRPFEGGI